MRKILFISYSHDSDEHMAWVKKFTDDLAVLGDFEILLDQNLPKGYSFTRFMESGLANADKVLVIGTPEYKKKSETGKGVAFEESIISTELMHDIDTLKYYPILRHGSYDTSFPPILQGRNGDDMTDDESYDEKVKVIADAIMNEKPIPAVLVKNKKAKEVEPKSIADVYFSDNIMLETNFGAPTGKILGIAIGVTVTNTCKEVRYFNQPSFKLSEPIEGTADAFVMTNMVEYVGFPQKLDYGQQFFVSYRLVSGNIEMFARVLEKDPNATIKAVVTTSLGERIESNSYSLSKIVQNGKYVK